MRLYISGNSKEKIGYVPDYLIIQNGSKEYQYSIEGECDYDIDNISCRTKGDLLKRNDELDEYISLNEEDEKEIIKLLKDKNSKITINLYPISPTGDDDSKFYELVKKDVITDCSAELDLWINKKIVEIGFDFCPEFVG